VALCAERSAIAIERVRLWVDALSALPPWVRERYAAEHFADASNEVTE
jgi:hypothetical protein